MEMTTPTHWDLPKKFNFLVENSLCMMYVIVCARDIRNKRNDNCGKYGAGDMTFVRFKT